MSPPLNGGAPPAGYGRCDGGATPISSRSYTSKASVSASGSASRTPSTSYKAPSPSSTSSKSKVAVASPSSSRSRPPVQYSPSASPVPATEGDCGFLSDGKGAGYGVSCLDNLCCSQYGASLAFKFLLFFSHSFLNF
jgi:hypothetical protein